MKKIIFIILFPFVFGIIWVLGSIAMMFACPVIVLNELIKLYKQELEKVRIRQERKKWINS